MKKAILLAFLLCGFSWLLPGLDPQKRISQYSLVSWKTERGLPINTVLSLAQDRDGYLWIGTPEELVRFDGLNFTAFGGDVHPAFRGGFISSLLVGRDGTLWIGTYRGHLLSLEKGVFREYSFVPAAVSSPVNCLAEDSAGRLWIGTFSGLYSVQPGSGGRAVRSPAFAGVRILALAADPDGALLVSTANRGLHRLSGEAAAPLLPEADRVGSDVQVICRARDGSLWLGADDGLYHWRNRRLRHLPLFPGREDNVVSLLEDRDGNVWVGSEVGLFRVRGGVVESLTAERSLGSNYVYALHEDAEGSLWLGMVEGGLAQLRDEKFTVLGKPEGLDFELVRCLRGDAGGSLWIGGRGGILGRFRAGRMSNFPLPAGLRSEVIWSVTPEADGSMLLGLGRGMRRFRGGRYDTVALPPAFAAAEIHCAFRDRSGRLWIGAWGPGLLCIAKGKATAFSAGEGMADRQINSVVEDREGRIWVGSEDGVSIARFGPDGAPRFEPLLRDCQALSFYEDGRRVMWIATRRHGLKVFKDGRCGSLKSDRGLFDNRIYAILEDGMGYLWLNSERGIFRARKSDLEQGAFDPGHSVTGKLFDENDGLRSRICNSGSPSAWMDDAGRMWFATLKGAAVIDPARLHPDRRLPPVLVEKVVVDSRRLPLAPASPQRPLILTAGKRRFEFTYTALSFVRSGKIAFRYKLEGYDRDWIDAGNRRQAFYNDLKPGHYRLRVIAANADGVWNLAGASLSFRLRPFVYQTWWFMALAALGFGAFSALSWQLMKKYLKAVRFWKKKTHIGHFKVLETIGTGGMAVVYKAQDLLNRKRIVALKVLSDENFHDEAQRKRFKHESLITERLDHPHIVRIYERGELEGCWYIAMELLAGVSLARLIKEKGRLGVEAALDIMRQVVDALGAIHALDIIHRDLKPENIMVSERGNRRHFVKLLDFGLAITPAQSRLTMSGVVMGTIRYLPPERIHNGVSSAAGDIYSAGIIFYEMLTAARPFWSEATGEVIHRILETYPVSAREINPAVPAELDALIQAMIDKDPAKRPSLREIEAKLNKLCPDSDVGR